MFCGFKANINLCTFKTNFSFKGGVEGMKDFFYWSPNKLKHK